MADTVEWVSDQLYEILGLSDHYTAEFLVGLAKKTSSTDTFLSQLQDTGAITINDSVRDFASQLWQRVPHKTTTEKPARAKEREAILQNQKNKSYQFLLEPEDDEDSTQTNRRTSISGRQGK